MVGATTLVQVLLHWGETQPEKILYTFVDDEGNPVRRLTYRSTVEHIGGICAGLEKWGVQSRSRVLLVYPPGLDFIVAYLACLAKGVIPVPVYPPSPSSLATDITKLYHVVQDCDAQAILTTGAYHRMVKWSRLFGACSRRLRWPSQPWYCTDGCVLGPLDCWVEPRQEADVAFLQYTSGSTADPKGVMVTHGALMHNVRLISAQLGRPAPAVPPSSVEVSWLPQYHDMGLVGGYLVPLYVGMTGVYMSPLSFLKDPLLWLQVISEYRGTHTQAPDFAFALCARRARLSRVSGAASSVATKRARAQLTALNLSCVRHVFNAADTVR